MTPTPPPPPKPAAPPAGLSADLCKAAAEELAKLGAVIKVYGCPIAVTDLERMKNGGVQDRKDDLMRLTSNQLSDTNIFARLLNQFLDGCKAGKYPKGQAVELMGRSVGAAAPSRIMGSSLAPGPKIAAGLQRSVGGAAFKPQSTATHDRQLAELVAKCLEESQATLKDGALNKSTFLESGLQLERITRHIDAVMVQRVFRDTLRSCKATAGMGLDALRLLSPLADAVEYALAASLIETAFTQCGEALPHVRAAVTAAKAQVATKLGQDGRSVDTELAALSVLEAPKPAGIAPSAANAADSVALPLCVKAASAAARGLDLSEQSGGFAGAVYRRVMVDAKQPVYAGIVALGVLAEAVHKVAPQAIPPPALELSIFRALTKPAPAPADGAPKETTTWPPLRAEELVLISDRIFDPNANPKDAVPGAAAGAGRGPARTLITLRGDWVARTQVLNVCQAALRPNGPLADPKHEKKKAQVQSAQRFLAGLEDRVREEILNGLYQMATGDPDQRTRQIGLYLTHEATAALKPGLTLGPLRVAFAKWWRQIEAT